ncbi:MAG: hypothetical protein JST79_19375 [Acidobacteria bacterium]|nr:hypothetical protein [Acidobacteriota bacterium]
MSKRLAWAFLGVCALFVFAVAAHADSVADDPRIIVRDPACPYYGCNQVGTTFNVTVPQSGTGAVFFTNTSGQNWYNLRLIETGVPANLITCITDAFANCSVTTVNGITTIFLSGIGDCFDGIKKGANFEIIFGCTNGHCNPWPSGLAFSAAANVAEPGALAMLLLSLAAMAGGLKWRQRTLRLATLS